MFSFLYLLKISENLWFSDIFRGYKKGTAASNGLKYIYAETALISFVITHLLHEIWFSLGNLIYPYP